VFVCVCVGVDARRGGVRVVSAAAGCREARAARDWLVFMLGMATWWFFLLPLILPICVYAFAIFWGYKVMQKSK